MSSPAIQILDTSEPGFEVAFRRIEQRRELDRRELGDVVAAVVADVRARGDEALLEYTERFDGYRLAPEDLVWDEARIAEGAAELPADQRDAIARAAQRVRAYHEHARPQSWEFSNPGERLGQRVTPLARVGLYVPAFQAPLPSSVLMLGMPAAVAGVPDLSICSPGERPHPAILEAARLVGVKRLYPVGGSQAIAALAYGTERITRVDKITGPGSAYTQEAKRQVFGQVAIDAEAGPSEVFIVAEPDARPDFLAADLLAQAEHDPRSSVVLATPSADLVAAVAKSLEAQLADLPRDEVARAALGGVSAIVITRDLEEACELCHRYAPEHLQLFIADAERWLPRLAETAGAIFVGPWAPVPLGDYVAGPSHVLPTGGTSRFFSVVGVEDFVRRTSVVHFERDALARIGPDAARLADLEGLDAHARAVRLRLNDEGD